MMSENGYKIRRAVFYFGNIIRSTDNFRRIFKITGNVKIPRKSYLEHTAKKLAAWATTHDE